MHPLIWAAGSFASIRQEGGVLVTGKLDVIGRLALVLLVVAGAWLLLLLGRHLTMTNYCLNYGGMAGDPQVRIDPQFLRTCYGEQRNAGDQWFFGALLAAAMAFCGLVVLAIVAHVVYFVATGKILGHESEDPEEG